MFHLEWLIGKKKPTNIVLPLGYNAIPSSTPPGTVGSTLSVTCSQTGALVGNTTSNQLSITCGNSGTYSPANWTECIVACTPVPAETGYNGQPAGTPTVPAGSTLLYSCLEEDQIAAGTNSRFVHVVRLDSKSPLNMH